MTTAELTVQLEALRAFRRLLDEAERDLWPATPVLDRAPELLRSSFEAGLLAPYAADLDDIVDGLRLLVGSQVQFLANAENCLHWVEQNYRTTDRAAGEQYRRVAGEVG